MSFNAVQDKYSERLDGANMAVDVNSLSSQAARFQIAATVPNLTQGTTTLSNVKIVGQNCYLEAAWVGFNTVPAVSGGTATLSVITTFTDGTTVTVLTGPDTILGLTNLIPTALTVQATNLVPTVLPPKGAQTAGTTYIPAGATIQVQVLTSSNTVGTQQVGGEIVLVMRPLEDLVITQAQT